MVGRFCCTEPEVNKIAPVQVIAKVAGYIHFIFLSAAHTLGVWKAVKWLEDKSASKDWVHFLT